MRHQQFVVVLVVIGVLLSACSSLSPSGPSDEQAKKVITDNIGGTNLVIKDKQQCEISANTKATGVSERWIITFDEDGFTNNKMTIDKADGEWRMYTARAYCGQ